jgi:hypothetical protein
MQFEKTGLQNRQGVLLNRIGYGIRNSRARSVFEGLVTIRGVVLRAAVPYWRTSLGLNISIMIFFFMMAVAPVGYITDIGSVAANIHLKRLQAN